jgi:hypothetical protein
VSMHPYHSKPAVPRLAAPQTTALQLSNETSESEFGLTPAAPPGWREEALRKALIAVADSEKTATAALAETARVRERLQVTTNALRTERASRAHDQVLASVQASEKAVAPAPGDGRRWWRPGMFLAMLIACAAMAAGVAVFYAYPFEGWKQVWWKDEPARAAQPAIASSPSHSSSQTKAFSRLSDALGSVPAPSVPALMNAANQALGSTGEPACSVASPDGQLSLVISGKGNSTPLLAALSRCATAVERITQPDDKP